MYKVFDTIESLYHEIEEDKNQTGEGSAMRNRYPMRFVLFENFSDFYKFTDECTNHEVVVQSIDRWMKEGDDDTLLTYSRLGELFKEYIGKVPPNDLVVAPFSEITRFYENSEKNAEFDSLVKSIRLIESQRQAQEKHQRIYVPIIGMQNKMDRFKNDINIHIWEYRSSSEAKNYRLILTPGTLYGVNGLESKYTICKNVREWIALWRKGEVRERIICSSLSLLNNAHNAQPDNAFEYTICRNAYEFLSKGLELHFGSIEYETSEMAYWEKLAKDVDITDFDFHKFVMEKFNASSLGNVTDFLKAWHTNKEGYSRWLLKTYYITKQAGDTYMKRVLMTCNSLSTSDLFSKIATLIFEEPQNEKAIKERSKALREGALLGVKTKDEAERVIKAKLKAIALDPERSFYTAMRYISPISLSEKLLMIKWLGEGHIDRDAIKELYPELYIYTSSFEIDMPNNNEWINLYFSEYRKSKIANASSQQLCDLLLDKNASPTAFSTWRDKFKTVKTVLYGRNDIDVYYWIDGMGVDWIPFIKSVIEKYEVDNVFLNEVHIATAELPTCTLNNKIKLQELCGDKLIKAGDIDEYAHKQKKYPEYIDEEFSIMKKSISAILEQYNGKKVAFVSDHGISYLACHARGMNVASINSDHYGRCGEWKEGLPSNDNRYIILDDGKTVCSLTHNSLTSKVPEGQGAHGGATPEEVLVPIIIVSNQKNATHYSAQLQNYEIVASSPVLTYFIKGLNSIYAPVLEYNGVEYLLKKKGENTYESERLNLVNTVTEVTLKIGQFTQTDSLVIKTGVDEDNDLFGNI